MLEILAPAIRILIMAAFLRLATLGWFTPQDASELTKVVMDMLVYGLPALYAAWATERERRRLAKDRKP